MDEMALPRILEPFSTTKEIGRDTGLGLARAYAIVTDLHGAIDVESAPTQGSIRYARGISVRHPNGFLHPVNEPLQLANPYFWNKTYAEI